MKQEKKYFSSKDKANWVQKATMKWIWVLLNAPVPQWKPHKKPLSASGKPNYINKITQIFKLRDTSKLVW